MMSRSQRLIQMMMIINAKKAFTVQELADEFGLSTRTITRDLLELSELGVPIYSIQGRGGGYRLLQERILPPISFSESEAIALFFASQSLQFFGALPFDEGVTSAMHKFYHYLPPDTKAQIDRLKNKVAIWSPHRTMIPECLRTLLQAIMIPSVVTIKYSSSDGVRQRDIQPIGLYSSAGYWYCPAYCFYREAHRLFRADRIRSVSLNVSIPYREDIGQSSLLDPPVDVQGEQISLKIELTQRGVWLLESDVVAGPSIEQNEDGSGTATILISPDKLNFYVDLIWQLGEEAKIIEPRIAVETIKQKINAVLHKY